PAVTPERLPSRNSRLLDREVMYAELKPVKTAVLPEKQEEMAVRLPEDAVREKMGLNNLSVTKVAKAGLNLVANLSGEKFTFETNKEGQITELNYDSRLLAFSIPTNHNK